jgi:hypothetical protein
VTLVSTVFAVLVVSRIVIALWQAFPRGLAAIMAAARQFALPFACFSISSLLVMEVVHDIAGHGTISSSEYAPSALWSGLICSAALLLILCTGAFAFTRIASNTSVSFYAVAAAGPATLIACLFWTIITIASAALWPLGRVLRSAGIHAPGLDFSSLQLVNLGFALGFLAVMIILVLVSGGFSWSQEKISVNPAPGWPSPPPGWTPPLNWQPDPTWPTAPKNWQLLLGYKSNYRLLVTGFIWASVSAAALIILLGHGTISHWLTMIV